MRDLYESTRFKRDLRKVKKRGKDIRKLQAIINQLRIGEPLASHHRKHRLNGDWAHYWECHIEPDWLLLWEENDHEIRLARTGTHADATCGSWRREHLCP